MKTTPQRKAYNIAWKLANPAKLKLYRRRRRELQRTYAKTWRAANRRDRRLKLDAWRAANPEKARAMKSRSNRRYANGTSAKWPCTGERGCPVMMRWPGQVCAHHRQQPVMTMHDRAIGYQDWWRSGSSLPPLRIYKSRAKR